MRGNFRIAIVTGIVLLASGCDKSPKKDSTPPPVDSAPASFHANALLPSGKLNRRSLIEFAMAVRDYKPKDEFSVRNFNDAPLVGRTFRIDLDMADPQNADLTKIYIYDVDEHVLRLLLYPGAIYVLRATTTLPSETRSNAFGATVQVSRHEIESFGVGPIIDPYDHDQSKMPKDMGVFPMKSEISSELAGTEFATYKVKYSFSDIVKNIPMTPERARILTSDLHLIIEGIITKDAKGKSVECDMHLGNTATINNPEEAVINECTVSAQFTKIQITSPKAGILAAW